MSTTSLTLLHRLARGDDEAAWGRFVELYTPLMLNWGRRLQMSDMDAADLVQSTFLVLYEKLPGFQYDASGSFRAWLKTVLSNSWRNQLRKARMRTAEGSVIDPDQVPDTDPRIEIDEAEYRTYLVKRALDLMQAQFAPDTWKACWEFVVNDRPAVEVAKELGMTVNAVYLAKSRVLRHLRAELAEFLS
jgi:RNA polymerase sigma-70 factor, ECF subfamily